MMNQRKLMTPYSILFNFPLISAIVAFFVAQSMKILTVLYKNKIFDPKQLIGCGGMPSSHSSTVTALAMAIGLQEGFGGSAFATALILAIIVMYDATGVRFQAGQQAVVLNQIVVQLPAEHPLSYRIPLREVLGHTMPQVVAGGLLGILVAVLGHVIAM